MSAPCPFCGSTDGSHDKSYPHPASHHLIEPLHKVIAALIDAYADSSDIELVAHSRTIHEAISALSQAAAGPPDVIAALAPFADIGCWLFARNVPDETVMVEIDMLNGAKIYLTRGHFKAAHLAREELLAAPEQTAPKCKTCDDMGVIIERDVPYPGAETCRGECPDCTPQQPAPGCVCELARDAEYDICAIGFNDAVGNGHCTNPDPRNNGLLCGHDAACHDSGKGER